MTQQLDPETRQALADRIRFYRDLGLTEFYRRPVDPALTLQHDPERDMPRSSTLDLQSRVGTQPPGENPPSVQMNRNPEQVDFKGVQPIPPDQPLTGSLAVAPEIPQAGREAALRAILEDIGECTRCALHKGRNKLVFGDGIAHARLMFVGEGPGADEDAQGLPFVGRAGQLLNNMIAAMGLKREEVYIANVVKCRPPGNRTPEPQEANTCSPFLIRQIDVVRPEVLVALGATAATCLLGQRQPLAALRGRLHSFRGARLVVTYHPAYLLRDPRQKKEAWADLQIAMHELGLKPPSRS